MSLVVQRADERFVTRGPGWVGRYCFSYDEHYDPANVSFGAMLACNEFLLEPGAGFGRHSHAGVDIVTVVLSGVLTHLGPEGPSQRPPGTYVLWTGTGLEHDERSDTAEPVRFLQAWFQPGSEVRPRVVRADTVQLDEGAAFVFAGVGDVTVNGEVLHEGDSVRADGAMTVSAGSDATAVVWRCG